MSENGNEIGKRFKSGFVLGKFCPLHEGHAALIRSALDECERVYVVVDPFMSDEIPAEKRKEWIEREFNWRTDGQPKVLILGKTLPQSPDETPDFWDIWKRELLALLPEVPEAEFGSEPYVETLAKVLGIPNAVVRDRKDSGHDVSGTAARSDWFSAYEELSLPVREDWSRRVCVVGPESCGKTTLVRNLSRIFGCPYVPEIAEEIIRKNGGEIFLEQMSEVFSFQDAAITAAYLREVGPDGNDIKALRPYPAPITFCDTDAIESLVWEEFLFGYKGSEFAERYVRKQENAFDLYLLCRPDLKWVPDVHRMAPDTRPEFYARLEEELKRRGRKYVAIGGRGKSRTARAVEAVKAAFGIKKRFKI